jgi:hypothetical protein
VIVKSGKISIFVDDGETVDIVKQELRLDGT